MARPKKENKKDIQYRVRLDAETAAELESLRKKSGMCKAWIIRELIHTAHEAIFINGKGHKAEHE